MFEKKAPADESSPRPERPRGNPGGEKKASGQDDPASVRLADAAEAAFGKTRRGPASS